MMVVIYPDVQNIRKDNVYFSIYQGVEEDLSKSLGVPVSSVVKGSPPGCQADNHPSCKAQSSLRAG